MKKHKKVKQKDYWDAGVDQFTLMGMSPKVKIDEEGGDVFTPSETVTIMKEKESTTISLDLEKIATEAAQNSTKEITIRIPFLENYLSNFEKVLKSSFMNVTSSNDEDGEFHGEVQMLSDADIEYNRGITFKTSSFCTLEIFAHGKHLFTYDASDEESIVRHMDLTFEEAERVKSLIYLRFISFIEPSVVYDKDEFYEEFGDVDQFDYQRFVFISKKKDEKKYICAYYITDNSYDTFRSFMSDNATAEHSMVDHLVTFFNMFSQYGKEDWRTLDEIMESENTQDFESIFEHNSMTSRLTKESDRKPADRLHVIPIKNIANGLHDIFELVNQRQMEADSRKTEEPDIEIEDIDGSDIELDIPEAEIKPMNPADFIFPTVRRNNQGD